MESEATGAQPDTAQSLMEERDRLKEELEAERSRGFWRKIFGLGPRMPETTDQTRERMRGVIANALIRTLIVIVVATFVYLWWLSRTFTQLTPDELVTVIPMVGTTLLTPLIGLIGAVTGFYYGGQAAAQATQATQAATQATMETASQAVTQAAAETARAVTRPDGT